MGGKEGERERGIERERKEREGERDTRRVRATDKWADREREKQGRHEASVRGGRRTEHLLPEATLPSTLTPTEQSFTRWPARNSHIPLSSPSLLYIPLLPCLLQPSLPLNPTLPISFLSDFLHISSPPPALPRSRPSPPNSPPPPTFTPGWVLRRQVFRKSAVK